MGTAFFILMESFGIACKILSDHSAGDRAYQIVIAVWTIVGAFVLYKVKLIYCAAGGQDISAMNMPMDMYGLI